MTDRIEDNLRVLFGEAFEDLRHALAVHPHQRYDHRNLEAITTIVVHHTAARRSVAWQAVATYHVHGRDWPGIAYHVGLRTDKDVTRVSLLNDLSTVSYHAGQANSFSIGVCVAGEFHRSDQPLEGEKVALLSVIEAIDNCLGAKLKVVGHRDVGDTTCPGDNLYAFVQQIPSLLDQKAAPAGFRKALIAEAGKRQVLQLYPDAALQKAILHDGYVPTSPEFDLSWDGSAYRCQRAERMDASEARVYYAIAGQWDRVRFEAGAGE